MPDQTDIEDWPSVLYRTLRAHNITSVSYVPDAGHTALIDLMLADTKVTATLLTSEEEGVALAAGAWLGGGRSVLLMQSSGVGNCINMLSLTQIGRFPFLTLVTMRGEWAEFNPWQVPMGSAVEPVLSAMGVKVLRADDPRNLIESVDAGARLAFEADQQVAVLISQKLIGAKKW